MRMDVSKGVTAADVVNNLSADDLSDIIETVINIQSYKLVYLIINNNSMEKTKQQES